MANNQPALVREIADDEFDEAITSAPVVLAEFWNIYCGSCRPMAAVLERLAEEFGSRLNVVKLNTEKAPKTKERFQVKSVPTMLLFSQGKLVQTVVGAVPAGKLKAEIESALGTVLTEKQQQLLAAAESAFNEKMGDLWSELRKQVAAGEEEVRAAWMPLYPLVHELWESQCESLYERIHAGKVSAEELERIRSTPIEYLVDPAGHPELEAVLALEKKVKAAAAPHRQKYAEDSAIVEAEYDALVNTILQG